VLAELGVSGEKVPIIEVWNKIDLLPRDGDGAAPALAGFAPAGKVAATVAVSAATGEGLPELLAAVETALAERSRTYKVRIEHAKGADLGWLYAHAEIMHRDEPDEAGTTFEVRVDPRHSAAFAEKFGGRIEMV
jgi:GTPase